MDKGAAGVGPSNWSQSSSGLVKIGYRAVMLATGAAIRTARAELQQFDAAFI